MAISLHDKVNRRCAYIGIGLVSVSAFAMNAKYSMSLGSDDFERVLMLAVSLGIDTFKFFGLTFIAAAAVKRKWLKAAAAMFVWSICVLYATTAAMGFATMTRSHVVAANDYRAEKINHVKEAFERARDKYKTANEELQTMKGNERYKSTAGCTVPEERMRTASRYFCTDFKTKKDEVAVKEISYKEALKNAPKDEFVVDSDPQMTFFASMSGVKKTTLVQYWALAIALVIETISALGNFAISPSRMAASKGSQEQRNEVPRVPVVEVKKRRGRPPGSKNKPKLHVVA